MDEDTLSLLNTNATAKREESEAFTLTVMHSQAIKEVRDRETHKQVKAFNPNILSEKPTLLLPNSAVSDQLIDQRGNGD